MSCVGTRRSQVLIWGGVAVGIVLIAALVVWTAPRWLVATIAKRAPGCLYNVHTDERIVALTVDDGPATATTEILRVLRENDASATFFLISTQPADAYRAGLAVRWWDFLFYASFGVVVTSSVRIAGVLLVFSYLIVPALAVLMCGGLLLHTGATSIAAAAVLTVVGYALTFRRGVRDRRQGRDS